MSFFDDIEDDLDTSDDVLYTITRWNVNTSIEDYVKSVFSNVTLVDPCSEEELSKKIFDILTSAKYHLSIGALYAKAKVCEGRITSQSKLRYDEVIALFSRYLKFFSDGAITTNVENLAINTPEYVIYFHMDDKCYSHELRQLNKYLYNDVKRDILPVYDSENGMNTIPYDEWKSALNDKPVLMFGWEEKKVFESIGMQAWNCFLGKYKIKGVDKDGNFELELSSDNFNFWD
ncbi:MAG: hypothetical protein K2G35_06540 [Duncaniella sp.]|nr:hypothetical protein [Duncaniella sp.]